MYLITLDAGKENSTVMPDCVLMRSGDVMDRGTALIGVMNLIVVSRISDLIQYLFTVENTIFIHILYALIQSIK